MDLEQALEQIQELSKQNSSFKELLEQRDLELSIHKTEKEKLAEQVTTLQEKNLKYLSMVGDELLKTLNPPTPQPEPQEEQVESILSDEEFASMF